MVSNLKKVTITKLLLRHRQTDGPWLKRSLEAANIFFLGAILDYQIKAHTAWENGSRLARDIAGDAKRPWQFIAGMSLEEWMARFRQYSLHRFPKAHERVWRIAHDILEKYDGDPRRIWQNESIEKVLEKLNEMRVGQKISRMIVGALIDTGILAGTADIAPDMHVRRVLGRVLRGTDYKLKEMGQVLKITRQMHPQNPWLLDDQLYHIGKRLCHANSPECSGCYLAKLCTFYGQSRL